MSSPTVYDCLIIGQGLAGSLLAWHLMEAGQKIMVIDNGHETSASRVAAGLVNPVTGMRLVKTVHADQYLPVAHACYGHLESRLDGSFFHDKPMLRLVRREKEQQVLEKRRRDPAYAGYLGESYPANSQFPFRDPLGSFLQHRTGYLDTVSFLDSLQDYLVRHGSYLAKAVQPADLTLVEDGLHLDGMKARQLVFCEGYRAMHNPWFDWLPFQAAKGEILTLELPQIPTDRIINGPKWLLPLSNQQQNLFRLGASYDRNTLDEQVTTEARTTLLEELGGLLRPRPDYRIISQQAGVRPCTKDTLPFIGRHPRHPQLAIFNGFGSKGSMMIPFYAEKFTQFLVEHTELPVDVDIQRFYSQ